MFSKEKTSKYNVIVPYQDIRLLYNQISGAMMELTSVEYEKYLRIQDGKICLSPWFKKLLRRGKFLIPKSIDELTWMKNIFQLVNKISTDEKSLTIAPTDLCNLNCSYCFEEKSDKKLMDQQTEEQLMRFCERFLMDTPTKRLHITWYGGEPLMHLSLIERLSIFLAEVCRKIGADYVQTMVTNGTMLTTKNIERLRKIGCIACQVTLDGPKECHDEKRPYKLPILGQSSFDQIIQNLKMATNAGFSISVRVNLDEKNKEHYHELVRELTDLGIIGTGANAVYPARIHSQKNLLSMEEVSALQILGNSACTCGLQPFSGKTCMCYRKYALAISQNGRITKCWHHVTNEEYSIGDVYNLDLATNGYVDSHSPFDDLECRNCHVLPTCMGGCRHLNEYWEKGVQGLKYIGCARQRFCLEQQVIDLYEKNK